MPKIKIAIVGVGNCASALIQGIAYYDGKQDEQKPVSGLMHQDIGGYQARDIEVAAAFDVDERKVGRDLTEAIFSPPNCTTVFCADVPFSGVTVRMGRTLDGIAPHMREYDPQQTVLPAPNDSPRDEIVAELRKSGAELLLNYLPVGSEAATRFYAECALEAGLGFINNIPVFIASDPEWAARFAEKGLPLIGDDVKSQFGATIVHRVLAELFRKRGVAFERTYQLNTGGNTDFLNMLDRHRLQSKKISKTEAVQAALGVSGPAENIHVGPSDYVAWQKDNKVCFIRMEGRLFGDVPMNLELRLSVEDSPNSAGAVIDAIRCARVARDRGIGGALRAVSASYYKHPPEPLSEDDVGRRLEEFISGT
jgi:myo-inositol-1-phosphate synthase